MKLEKAKILVEGIVQGVGFRPTVYRIAHSMMINGFVRNLGNIVEIVIEGKEQEIEDFVHNLEKNKPPISRLHLSKLNGLNLIFPENFTIFKYSRARKISLDLL